MKVRELMTTAIQYASPDTTLDEIARRMRAQKPKGSGARASGKPAGRSGSQNRHAG